MKNEDNHTETSSWSQKLSDMWKSSFPPRGSSLGFYVGIEGIWHITLFAACYKFRPLVRLTKTPAGKRVYEKIKGWVTPTSSRGQTATRWAGTAVRRIPGGNRTIVAASEWVFFNKVLGIPLWPSKLFLASILGHEYEKKKEEILVRRETLRKQQQEEEEAEKERINASYNLKQDQQNQQQEQQKVQHKFEKSAIVVTAYSPAENRSNIDNHTHHRPNGNHYSF